MRWIAIVAVVLCSGCGAPAEVVDAARGSDRVLHEAREKVDAILAQLERGELTLEQATEAIESIRDALARAEQANAALLGVVGEE